MNPLFQIFNKQKYLIYAILPVKYYPAVDEYENSLILNYESETLL
jgi:hypothetical protein